MLTNTSQIPIKYKLRIPEDGSLLQKEFDIIPNTGTILPHSSKPVKLEFLSNTIKKYIYSLLLDIVEVGDAVHKIPITAECTVPDILLSTNKITFGECFVGYNYQQSLELGNKTSQPAKFEIVLPGDDETRQIGITADSMKGVVPSKSTQRVAINIATRTVGTIYAPIYVKIVGSEKPPVEVSVSAISIGPTITTNCQVIDFGNLKVLTEEERKLNLSNSSPIPALIGLSFKHDTGVFTLMETNIEIPPQQTKDIVIKAKVDDSIRFTEELLISVNNGETISTQLIAIGKGNSIVSSVPLDTLHFDKQFTQKPCFLNFTLTNMGRKTHTLQWIANKQKKKDVRFFFSR